MALSMVIFRHEPDEPVNAISCVKRPVRTMFIMGCISTDDPVVSGQC